MVGTQEKLDGKWTELILYFFEITFVTQSILINGDLDLKVGGVWLHLPGFRTGWNHPMDFPHGYGSQVTVASQRRLQERRSGENGNVLSLQNQHIPPREKEHDQKCL